MIGRIVAGVCVLMVAAGVGTPLAQNDISGSWTLMINGPQGAVQHPAV